MATMENIPFDELEIGTSATYTKVLTDEDMILFAKISGDVNPVHLDEEFAKESLFKGRIGHGMWAGAVISAAVATVLPGPGSIYMEQNLQFRKPVRPGDELTVTLTVTEKIEKKRNKIVALDCSVANQEGVVVVIGDAKVLAPEEKVVIEKPVLPTITIG